MKTIKLFLKFILLSLLYTGTSAANIKQVANGMDTASIVFTGTISDLQGSSDSSGETMLHIYISSLPFTYLELNTAPHLEFVVRYKAGETFRIKVPKAAKVNYAYIAYNAPMDRPVSTAVNWIDNIYMVNAGDRIFCELKADTRIFSGKGAGKLNLQQKLYEARYLMSETLYQKILDSTTLAGALDEIDSKCDSVYLVQKQIIDQYKDSVDQSTINMMIANCIGTRYYGILRSLMAKKSNYALLIKTKFYQKIGTHEDGIESEDLLQSPVYYNVELQKLSIAASLQKLATNTANEISLFQKIYKLISKRYTGSIRDKLTTLLILKIQTEGYRALPLLIGKIADDKYSTPLKILMNVKKKGRDFSKYSLTDTANQSINLSAFNDKVVLLDFWYIGCVACARLNESVLPIYEKFKNNPKVEFVTINVDKDYDRWQKGLSSGKYTHQNSINLYTGGMGSDHPIITENLIVAYPQLYVIKNGVIWDAMPPKPNGYSDVKNVNELSQLISKAINE